MINCKLNVVQVRLTDMLKTTELQAQDIQALLQLRATTKSLDSSSIRIDLAPYSHVHWLNNLEKVRQNKKRKEKKRIERLHLLASIH